MHFIFLVFNDILSADLGLLDKKERLEFMNKIASQFYITHRYAEFKKVESIEVAKKIIFNSHLIFLFEFQSARVRQVLARL
jgi:hypothetical protein